MAFDDGYTVVTTAGTRVQLTSTSTKVAWVTIIALPSNTSLITVGDIGTVAATGATYRGVGLNANDSAKFYHVDLSNMYIDSRVNGEGVTYLYG